MVRVARITIIVALAVSAVALAGCSLLPQTGKTRTVSDPQNIFHVKIPAKWQASTDPGYLSIYADKELPAEGVEPDALSVLVFTSSEPSTAPVADVVDYLIKARAQSRGWKKTTPGKPTRIELGGRDAHAVDVKATDSAGKEFESRYVFARTGGVEVFMVAVAPRGKAIGDYDDELKRLAAEWYWQNSETAVGSSVTTQ